MTAKQMADNVCGEHTTFEASLDKNSTVQSQSSSGHNALIQRSFWLHRTTVYATVLLPLPSRLITNPSGPPAMVRPRGASRQASQGILRTV